MDQNKVLTIEIEDEITGLVGKGTVVLIEADEDIQGLNWLYCLSKDPDMNTQFEPKLGYNIWRIIPSTSGNYFIEEEEING